MMAVGVGATAGYINWGGTPDYEATKDIFGDLRDGIVSNKKAKEEVDRLLKEEQNENLSLAGQIEVLNNEKAQLTTELASKNKTISDLEVEVDNSINKSVLATEIDKHILVVNSKNGPKHKYDYIMTQLNGYKNFLGLSNELGHHGQSDEDKQLEQAIKDMEEIRDEAQALKELLLNEKPATEETN